ncbi:hypothetical protein LA080_003088 [Diaporthe eres]|nr:hypothetical protein LA080_003088 [Diaporthe eres]
MGSTLVNEFPWARGRSVSSITLEPQVAKDLYAAVSRQGYREAPVTLPSLGQGKTKRGDEMWALKGSEWSFVLRRRHREDDEKRTLATSSVPSGPAGGGHGIVTLWAALDPRYTSL